MNTITNNPDFLKALNQSAQLIVKSLLAAAMTLLLFIMMYQLIKTDDFAIAQAEPTSIPPFVMPNTEITVLIEIEPKKPLPPVTPPARLNEDPSPDPNGRPLLTSSAAKWTQEKFTLAKPNRSEAMPLFRVNPIYPDRQLRLGIEGYVDLRFDINEIGATKNIQVIAAEPARGFNNAAIKAVSRWRYEPRVKDGQGIYQSNMTTRIRFSIAN